MGFCLHQTNRINPFFYLRPQTFHGGSAWPYWHEALLLTIIKEVLIFRELDPAVLRRLEKRIYVSLPDVKRRLEMLKRTIEKISRNVHESKQGKNSVHFEIDYEYLALVRILISTFKLSMLDNTSSLFIENGFLLWIRSASDIKGKCCSKVPTAKRTTPKNSLVYHNFTNSQKITFILSLGELTIDTEDILDVIASTPPSLKPAIVQKFESWQSTHQLD